jgi:hypothetical protein
MKKVLFFVTAVAIVSLSSCKKTTTCTYTDGSKIQCTSCTPSENSAFSSACSLAGGTYTK